jgi:hypothetical protein
LVKHKDKRVALYLRVSTSEQTTKNQRRELEAVAERHGWLVVSAFEDAGISGAKDREQRPGLDALTLGRNNERGVRKVPAGLPRLDLTEQIADYKLAPSPAKAAYVRSGNSSRIPPNYTAPHFHSRLNRF